MKFSIIIAAYNAERTINDCIKSLINQSYPDFEALIIDDGSTDNTGRITAELIKGDGRFNYLRQENEGPSSARNKGIERSKGTFLLFLDSDDQYEQNYLEVMNSVISVYPEYDHYWCGYSVITQNGEEKGKKVWQNASGEVSITDRSQLMDEPLRLLSAPLWNKAFRREIVCSFGLKMDQSISLGEDLLFNYSYIDCAEPQIVMIDQALYRYTEADNHSLNSKYRHDLKNVYDILDETILMYLQKWGASNQQMNAFYKSRFWHLEQVLRNTFRVENTASAKDKRAYNNSILSSDEFQLLLQYVEEDLHPLYMHVYRMKNWNAVDLLNRLSQMKQRLKRI